MGKGYVSMYKDFPSGRKAVKAYGDVRWLWTFHIY
jgi:hypothetical protein